MDETYILELYNQLGGEDKFGKIENFKNLISTNSGYQKQFYNSFGEQRLGSYDNFVGLVSGQKKKVIQRKEIFYRSYNSIKKHILRKLLLQSQ